jgi:hypothetical protein
MFSVQINAKEFTDLVDRVKAAGGSTRTILARWGQAVSIKARGNARAKGGKKFWRQIADSVRLKTLSSESVEVGVWHVAAGHKQTGGPIVAKNVKNLTIPIPGSGAEGKRASEFEQGGRDLFVPKGTHVLGYSDGNDQFHALYILTPRTKPQRPDPFFPDGPAISAIGLYEANRYIGGLLKAGGA